MGSRWADRSGHQKRAGGGGGGESGERSSGSGGGYSNDRDRSGGSSSGGSGERPAEGPGVVGVEGGGGAVVWGLGPSGGMEPLESCAHLKAECCRASPWTEVIGWSVPLRTHKIMTPR